MHLNRLFSPINNVQRYRLLLFLSVVIFWSGIFYLAQDKWLLVTNYWYFFILGLVGAIVANSTGAGGGIVFIPFFSAIGMDASETLGTSILIQCFGMTAGAISWLTSSHVANTNSLHLNRLISHLIIYCGFICIAGVLVGQYWFVVNDTSSMLLIFRAFSVLFGAILIYIVLFKSSYKHTHFHISPLDYLVLFFASFVGALITAWISVGIGEIVAITLILRRFPVMVAITIGVCMSSLSVLTSAYLHIHIVQSVVWEVIMFAVPAALLGGTFAYLLSEKLGPSRLKLFFATWILATGLTM